MGPNNLYFNKPLRTGGLGIVFAKSSWVLVVRRVEACVHVCVWPWFALSAMAAVASPDCLL